MFYKTLIIIIICFLTSCTNDLSKTEIAKANINDVIQRVEDAFNEMNINDIMKYYDEDFYHKGYNKYNQKIVWEDRMAEFNYCSFENINIDIDGDFAIVQFSMRLSSNSSEDLFFEPDDHGDLSYFKKINGSWMVYGNQQERK